MVGNLNLSIVQNCYSHAMKAAKMTILSHYKKALKSTAMTWISKFFSCDSLRGLDDMVSSFIILTNCKTTSKMIDGHFKHLTVGDIKENMKTEFSIDVDVH